MTDDERQGVIDGEHLRMLSICYFISAGLGALFSIVGLFYAFMGWFLARAISQMPPQPDQGPPPAFIGMIFALFGVGLFLFMVGGAVLQFMAARRLRQRRSRTLCMVAAALTCLSIPYGTAVGVFTFIVLSRPSVVRAFGSQGQGVG